MDETCTKEREQAVIQTPLPGDSGEEEGLYVVAACAGTSSCVRMWHSHAVRAYVQTLTLVRLV